MAFSKCCAQSTFISIIAVCKRPYTRMILKYRYSKNTLRKPPLADCPSPQKPDLVKRSRDFQTSCCRQDDNCWMAECHSPSSSLLSAHPNITLIGSVPRANSIYFLSIVSDISAIVQVCSGPRPTSLRRRGRPWLVLPLGLQLRLAHLSGIL